MNPAYFYKYRGFSATTPEAEAEIDYLFKRSIAFASRVTFNDLFDSKVKFITPMLYEYEQLKARMPIDVKQVLKRPIERDFFGFFERFKTDIDTRLDGYQFYCVSSKCDNHLMWSHYANSHNGICIELNSEFVPAEIIYYQEHIPAFELKYLLMERAGLMSGNDVGIMLWKMLRTKLTDWHYEHEYRLMLNAEFRKTIQVISEDKEKTIVQLPPEAINAVIFGFRCSPEHRRYIMEHNPNAVIYKEMTIQDYRLVIKNIDA